MWRKPSEANSPKLAGNSNYEKQVPISRAIPLWGGVSEDGFSPILWHGSKKTNADEWAEAVNGGKLTDALRKLNPSRKNGPWVILCDGEGFLRAGRSKIAYGRRNISLWDLPAKSPDLNPIENFWSWARQRLRTLDLADLRKKRKPLGKTAYKERLKSVLQSKKAKSVARSCVRKFRDVCKAVVAKKGAAAGN